jgi:hypothetical protein
MGALDEFGCPLGQGSSSAGQSLGASQSAGSGDAASMVAAPE